MKLAKRWRIFKMVKTFKIYATFRPRRYLFVPILFFGREDVFAIRWEKAGKSGYMPAYHYDPYHYAKHKISGGTFQKYPHKTYLPLNNAEIEKHIKGIQQIGVYPLLIDNTS